MLAIFYVYNNNNNEYFLRECLESNRIESKNIIL